MMLKTIADTDSTAPMMLKTYDLSLTMTSKARLLVNLGSRGMTNILQEQYIFFLLLVK